VHYEIVDALAARDGDAARTAMRRHFLVWRSATSP
jgi:DNA-binding GntR family transcriptional regulator